MAEDPDEVGRYSDALDRFLALGGGDLDARARAVCADLGLGARLDRPVEELSGGEAGRAALAAILLARFDVFLLDEPTNDLDLDGLARLEAFLGALEGGVVVISHDRAFLDATVTRVAELQPGTHRLREWAGGWSRVRGCARCRARPAYDLFERGQERQREIAALLSAGATRRAPAARRPTGAERTRSDEGAPGRAGARAGRRAGKPFEPWELHLALEAGQRTGEPGAALRSAVVERQDADFRLGPVELDLARASALL